MTIEPEHRIAQSIEVKAEKQNVVLYKATGEKDKLAIPWPLDWKIPGNAFVGIGVSQKKDESVVIAFAPGGRLPSHASMESVVAPHGSDRQYVAATLLPVHKQRTLQIHVLSDEDRRRAQDVGFAANPEELLIGETLNKVLNVLHATNYEFVAARNDYGRHLAQQRQAQQAPKSGLEYLLWKFRTRLEG